MRILQLCHKIPFPSTDGGSLAMNQITQNLIKEGIKVKVIALAPSGTESLIERIPESYIRETELEVFPIDTRVKLWPAFRNLFTRESYNISRFFCPKVVKRLGDLLQKESFDIIQMEGLFLTPYIPVIRQHTGSSLLFRSHNIEHFIWERMARATSHPLKKLYLMFLAGRLKAYEMKTVHQVDGLVAISPVDMNFFKKNGYAQPGVTIPFGIDTESLKPKDQIVNKNTVFHIGSMDWRPNQEGIKWFLEEVWPLVVKRHPWLKFVLAGKNIPEEFYQYTDPNVLIVGEVPDAAEFMQAHELMVVPLQSGGGMRIKIIEGMAAGKAIISTSIGAEGIDCRDNEHILLADTEKEMADTIIHCFENREIIDKIGTQACLFATKNYNIKPIIKKLITFYNIFTTPKDFN